MSHRTILTERQRAALFALPTRREELVARYVLSDADIEIIHQRKSAANRLGFALQLCAFRWPGRLLQPKEVIPSEMLSFVSAQLGIESEEALLDYGRREPTRYDHSASLQKAYRYRPFLGRARKDILAWLIEQAARSRANSDLAIVFLDELRRRQIIVPAASTVERLCGEAEKRAKVGDALRGGISWRCRVAVNSLLRKGYATCKRLPSRHCPIHRDLAATHSRTSCAMARAN